MKHNSEMYGKEVKNLIIRIQYTAQNFKPKSRRLVLNNGLMSGLIGGLSNQRQKILITIYLDFSSWVLSEKI